jgi:hypothetical protein
MMKVDRSKNLLFSGVILFPVAAWIVVICLYAVNIPWFDDFDPFPDFLRQWFTEDSTWTRLSLLIQPNNEHRMVFGKLAALASYLVSGRLNFVFLQAVGACFTLGTSLVIWAAFRRSGLKFWHFLPVTFFLFQFQDYLVFIWSICSLQHQPVIFFVCLSVYLLSKNRFFGGVTAAVCATFAMSNGIFVWVGGAVVLLLMSNFRQLVLWLAVGILSVGLYFYGMSAQGNESSFDFLIRNPHLSILGFLTFLGGLFDFFPWLRIEYRSVLPVLMGSLALIWLCMWFAAHAFSLTQLRLRFPEKLPRWAGRFINMKSELTLFSTGVLVFLLSNALVIGLLRPRFGFFVMLVSNYKIYPALFISLTYLAFLASATEIRAQVVSRWFFFGAILIWTLSAFNYLPAISERRKYLIVNAYNQEHNAFGLGHVPFSKGAQYVDVLMKYMTSRGLYHYPQDASFVVSELKRMRLSKHDRMGVEWTVKNGSVQLNDPDTHFNFGYNDGLYPFVFNEKNIYLFKMDQNVYTGRNPFRQFDAGSNLSIPLSTMPAGNYQLGLMRINGDVVKSGILGVVTVPLQE